MAMKSTLGIAHSSRLRLKPCCRRRIRPLLSLNDTPRALLNRCGTRANPARVARYRHTLVHLRLSRSARRIAVTCRVPASCLATGYACASAEQAMPRLTEWTSSPARAQAASADGHICRRANAERPIEVLCFEDLTDMRRSWQPSPRVCFAIGSN